MFLLKHSKTAPNTIITWKTEENIYKLRVGNGTATKSYLNSSKVQ